MPYKSDIKVTSEQIEHIIKNVRPNNSITSLIEIKKSFVNPVLDIGISSGENFILKINNPTWPLKQHREKKAIELVNTKTAIPVPKIIEADFSRALIPYDYMLLEKIEGNSLYNCLLQNKISKDEFIHIIHSLGIYLSELHQITFDFFGDISYDSQPISQKYPQSSGPFWGRTFKTWKGAFIALCNDNQNWVDTSSFPKYRKQLKKLIDIFADKFPQHSRGVFVHSDLQPTNILIKNGEISGIIDFEWSYSGSPNFDFALTKAGLFYSSFPSLETQMIAKFFPDLKLSEIDEVFTTAYKQKITNFIPNEIPDLIAFIWLSYMIGSWSWILKSSQDDEILKFTKDIGETFSYLIEHYL